MVYRIAFLLVILVSTTFAQTWTCRNDLEIRCTGDGCTNQSSFTPMSVNFDHKGAMNVCAYTGCWQGKGVVTNTANFMTVSGSALPFSTSPPGEGAQDISITLDHNDSIAIVKAGSFAHPMRCQSKTPTFEEYSVNVDRRRPKPIVFRNNPDARLFRTRLRNALKGGVNFGGRYIYASWGCGTGCLAGALIDTRTGVVYFPDEFQGMSFGFMGAELPENPIQFEKNSRLFILHATPGGRLISGKYYFAWEGKKFRQLKFVPDKKPTE